MIEILPLASGSKGNCYHITDGAAPLLLEAGISFKELQRGLDFQTSDLCGCLVTHEHADHSKAVKGLIRAGVDCYMSEGTRAALAAEGHRVKVICAREQIKVCTWDVLPFDTQHDAAEPLGFLLADKDGDKLLYATDTFYIRYRFRGLTHIMVECNYAMDILRGNVAAGLVPVELKNRILKSHFSLANVKEFLMANDLSRVREIWLLHLSDDNSDAERFKREIQELTGRMVYIA